MRDQGDMVGERGLEEVGGGSTDIGIQAFSLLGAIQQERDKCGHNVWRVGPGDKDAREREERVWNNKSSNKEDLRF